MVGVEVADPGISGGGTPLSATNWGSISDSKKSHRCDGYPRPPTDYRHFGEPKEG